MTFNLIWLNAERQEYCNKIFFRYFSQKAGTLRVEGFSCIYKAPCSHLIINEKTFLNSQVFWTYSCMSEQSTNLVWRPRWDFFQNISFLTLSSQKKLKEIDKTGWLILDTMNARKIFVRPLLLCLKCNHFSALSGLYNGEKKVVFFSSWMSDMV